MAARWIPESKIGKNEQIGRRLFDEPMLVGAQNQESFNGLDYRHFEDKRNNELSLDRLGKNSIEKKVSRYLVERAENASQKFTKPKIFNGWAVIHVKYLNDPPTGVTGQTRPLFYF